MAALAPALAGGGCSFSYQLGSLFDKSADDTASDITGSIGAASAAESESADAQETPENDLAYARAAAAEVLALGGAGGSLPWENPQTGARGTVTPLASAYTAGGMTCQDFLASYLREGAGESWLQGEACRVHKGKWEVRSLKPWKKSS
ncbi:MAG: RT0821/Lpp0805 family surface protein [Xanthobacteraceae bacterium]